MNLLVAAMLDPTLTYEIERPPVCESVVHTTHIYTHEGPGAFLVASDCGCTPKILCAKLVNLALADDGEFWCVAHQVNTVIVAAVPLD
jgi:hypothetical protein